MNAVDPQGRHIEGSVLSVAQEIAPQALCYAEKSVGDSCVAMNLFEEAAGAVSEAVHAKEAAKIPPIRDLRAYLYRAYLRRIAAEKQREICAELSDEDHLLPNEALDTEARVETKLLLKQILGMCDRKTRAIIWARLEGHSWDEIAHDLVMSSHAARLHYSKALRAIREAFRNGMKSYVEKVDQAECEQRKKSVLKFFYDTVIAQLLFRAVQVKECLGIGYRIACHEKQEILAEVDRMFG
jgi:DNA-directed RNA polymerase specialized sigma24 family protein